MHCDDDESLDDFYEDCCLPSGAGREMSWEGDHEKQVATFPRDVRDAHARSSNHREEIVASTICGCFHCGSRFPPTDIVEWVDEGPDGTGQTAMCPKCGIDSVIGDASGFDPCVAFLARMKAHWF